jgi:hypothetical protein
MPALSNCTIRPVSPPDVTVGIDVGEDFLDLATLQGNAISHRRVGLAGIEANPLEILRHRMLECCPGVNCRWLALIDSPRWPRDLECSSSALMARTTVPASRVLDRELRELLRTAAAHNAIKLSMFPTPALEYFRHCAAANNCKPHLRSIYQQLFEPDGATSQAGRRAGKIPGGTFTRFMLAGFLTFRVCEGLGVRTLEAYPELQFRLCSGNRLAPKRERASALKTRLAIVRQLRRRIALAPSPMPANLDQADAEILALSAALAARHGYLGALEHPAEGRFLLTFASC